MNARRSVAKGMSARSFALGLGIVFLVIGLGGFVPPLVTPLHPGHPPVGGGAGQLFGLFPVNIGHNLLHIAFGLWGLVASRSLRSATFYARGVALAYLLLTIFGTI